jgi:hypothetical protein
MALLVISLPGGEIKPYPRQDELPIVGLDLEAKVLQVVDDPLPQLDANQEAIPTQTVEITDPNGIINGFLRKGWQVVDLPPPIPEPQWVEFGGAVAAMAAVNQFLGTVFQISPGLYGSLTVGLGKAADGDSRIFLTAWGTAKTLGLVPTELTPPIQALAVAHHLPTEFVDAL